jgi:hypothetical protein
VKVVIFAGGRVARQKKLQEEPGINEDDGMPELLIKAIAISTKMQGWVDLFNPATKNWEAAELKIYVIV